MTEWLNNHLQEAALGLGLDGWRQDIRGVTFPGEWPDRSGDMRLRRPLHTAVPYPHLITATTWSRRLPGLWGQCPWEFLGAAGTRVTGWHLSRLWTLRPQYNIVSLHEGLLSALSSLQRVWVEVDGGREISMRARNGAKMWDRAQEISWRLDGGSAKAWQHMPYLMNLPLTKPCPKLAPKSVLCGMLMLV